MPLGESRQKRPVTTNMSTDAPAIQEEPLRIGQRPFYAGETPHPHCPWWMMSCKPGVRQIITTCVTVGTSIALRCGLRIINVALDDLCGLARWAYNAVWPSHRADGLRTRHLMIRLLLLTCKVGLLSGVETENVLRVHPPHLYDPGLQPDPGMYTATASKAATMSIDVRDTSTGTTKRNTPCSHPPRRRKGAGRGEGYAHPRHPATRELARLSAGHLS